MKDWKKPENQAEVQSNHKFKNRPLQPVFAQKKDGSNTSSLVNSPEEFEGETPEADASPRTAAKAKTVVSSAKRTTKSKKVVLKDSEVRLAHRLGLTPEDYVREKLKLEG